jgi:hypothetical protein
MKTKICSKCHIEKENSLSNTGKKIYRLSIDHSHNSKNIRGLLCKKCNTGIGMFKDNIQLLENAINYLKGTS